MPLIVSPTSAVNWSQTREQICTDALEIMNVIGGNESPQPDDLQTCIKVLEKLLKNIAVHGFYWPKITATLYSFSLTANVSTFTLPGDYYGQPLLTYFDSGNNERNIPIISLTEWTSIYNKASPNNYPTCGYIDNANVLHVYPVQSSTLSAKLSYQKIINDTAYNTATDLDAAWLLVLPYGIAFFAGDTFNKSDSDLTKWGAIWERERDKLIQFQSQPFPNGFAMDDY